MEMLLKLMQSETNTVTYEMTELRDNPDYIRYSVLSSGIIQIISGIVHRAQRYSRLYQVYCEELGDNSDNRYGLQSSGITQIISGIVYIAQG